MEPVACGSLGPLPPPPENYLLVILGFLLEAGAPLLGMTPKAVLKLLQRPWHKTMTIPWFDPGFTLKPVGSETWMTWISWGLEHRS